MITKAILAEKIQRELQGGDYTASTRIKDRDIYLVANSAYSYVVQKYINQMGDDLFGEFVTSYEDVLIQKKTSRNRLYSTLPAQLISLERGSGIRSITGMKDEYNAYIPMNAGDAAIFSGLEAGGLGGKIGYWLEGATVIYENMPMDFEGESVLIKMISSIYSLDKDAYIPIPGGVEEEFEERVLQKLGIQKTMPKDQNIKQE